MPIRIALVDGIVLRIGISVGADTRQCRVPCLRRDETGESRRKVAGVEEYQACLSVAPLADIALADRQRRRRVP